MAIGITYDINLGGIKGSLSTKDNSYDMVHLVHGVTGATAEDKIDQVGNYMLSLGFTIGSYISSGSFAWLRDMRIVPLGSPPEPDKFLVTLIYRSNKFQSIKIESNTSLNQVVTNLDYDGAPIELTYTYPSVWEPNPDFAGKTITQGGEFNKLVPERSVTFRIREEIDPALIADTYVGKLNSDTWRGGLSNTWMCTEISGNSDDSGTFFNNIYSFQYRKIGWNPYLAFHDSATGKPPPDIDASAQADAALIVPVVYAQVDFNSLFSYPTPPWT